MITVFDPQLCHGFLPSNFIQLLMECGYVPKICSLPLVQSFMGMTVHSTQHIVLPSPTL